MPQHYSNPKRESDAYALPDIETFYMTRLECDEVTALNDGEELYTGAGWYWQSCFPGCLPDGDPMGPFESEAAALADARDGMEDCDDV